ncbi:MAG: Bug family tripartite tricarboxylate transporter substrate binding protein [Xanthobacteraceae bacterium]
MNLTRRALIASASAFAVNPLLPAGAQEWPSRNIRFVVGTLAGGSADVIARVVGDPLSERLKQTIVIENNTQGAGAVAQQIVNKAAPDGHTMLMMTAGYPPQMAMKKHPPFPAIEGYSFVGMLCGYPFVYAVRPDSPIKSFKDLLARGKANPGKITYNINAKGSIYHVLTKWMEMEAGVEMTPIPYRGSGPAFTDVLAGRVDVMVDPATTGFARIRNGQLRILALSSPERFPLMPEAPTVNETVKGISFMSWLGLVMPPKTPAAIVNRLNMTVREVLATPDVQKKLTLAGSAATPSTPEEMHAKVATEYARWNKIIDAAKIDRQ